MGVRIRLKGLGQTIVHELYCPNCEISEDDTDLLDQLIVSTDAVPTYEGIFATVKCHVCGFFYIPEHQDVEIIDDRELKLKILSDMKKKDSTSQWDRVSVQASLDILNQKVQAI